MALDAELINLKSAGTYRFERDKSEISNDVITISNLRLVAGFSKMGPFNTVKLVTSPAQFIKLYGNIDRSLEKKGSFFHRSALAALSAGPILCLNLLNLDAKDDQVIEKSFSVSSGDVNKKSVKIPLQSLYNSDKFWFPSDEAFLDGIENVLDSNHITDEFAGIVSEDEWEQAREDWGNGLLHFSNIGKKPVSILVKKASEYSSKNFNLTLNEWYGEGNVPEYLNGTSYVSDYLVEVYVVGGDFGPALQENGTIDGLMGETEYDDVVKLSKYDIYKDPSTDEPLPYKRFSADIVYQSYYDEKGFIRGENDANLYRFLNLPSVDLRAKYVGSLIPNFIDKLGRNIWIQKLVNDDTDTIGLLCTENIEKLEKFTEEEENLDFINEKIDLIGHNVFARLQTEHPGMESVSPMKFDFLGYKFDYVFESQDVKIGEAVYTYKEMDNNAAHPFVWENGEGEKVYADSSYLTVDDVVYTEDGSDADSEMDYFGKVSEIVKDSKPLVSEVKFEDIDGEDVYVDAYNNKVYEPRDNEVILPLTSKNVVVGDYLVSESAILGTTNKCSRNTRVVEVKFVYKKKEEGKETADKRGILVVCADKIAKDLRDTGDGIVVKVTPIDKIADHFEWVCLNGFQVRKQCMPDGTNKTQNKILDMLRETPEFEGTHSNLFKALIDRDYVQFRYLVDTFGLGIEEECKKVYTQLCMARKSAFGIINAPSQLDFKKHKDPSFTNKSGGVEVEYIYKGGDLSKNPSFLFTLPKIENGASWGAYYYPYLRITDLSAPKSVPPAAYVSNLFIQKYTRGFAWSIVAGQKRGVISGNQVVGVEATLVHDNRDWLEPMGLNPIIWEQGVGVEVYANKTAKQTPVSALSSIHVREAAIYIQDGVEFILRRYVFEFNTAQVRMEIKTLVDEFLNNMKNNGGLYDFRTVMDTSNNTPEVIDNNMGVIDIYVEIVKGLEIIAQRLTILRTGAIQAGGFDE